MPSKLEKYELKKQQSNITFLELMTAVALATGRELLIHVIELYLDQYLVGKEFSPDVRYWPSPDELDVAVDWEQIKKELCYESMP